MKNLVINNNFENANNVINETKDERKAWHQQERTLTKLLHLAQQKSMMSFTRPLFEKVGLPTDGKLSRNKFLTYVQNFVETKSGKFPAYVRMSTIYEKDDKGKCVRDKDGKLVPQKDVNGNEIQVAKLTAIKDGTWTLEKLLKSVVKA